MTALQQGVDQISKEEGINVMGMLRSGEIKMGEVLQAAGRARQEKETDVNRVREDKDTKAAYGREDVGTTMGRANQDARIDQELRKEFLKKDLIERAQKGLIGGSPDIDKQYANYAGTQEAAQQRGALEFKTAAQDSGDSLRAFSDAIDAAVLSLTGYDAALHPVKGAQLAEPYAPSGKPGGPKTDWSTYFPGQGLPEDSAGKSSNIALAPHLKALETLVERTDDSVSELRGLHALLSKTFG